MEKDNKAEILRKYIVEPAIPLIIHLIEKHKIFVKIVNNRQTKHGDFKTYPNGQTQITVNNGLNKYQFLLTLIHEIAHHVAHEKFGRRIRPHGEEWKTIFKHLATPFLQPSIYPKEILPYLINYFKNPKASTDSDAKLSIALRGFKAENGKNFVFELTEGQIFKFRNELYQLGKKRRTRYECVHLTSKNKFLFNQNAEVDKWTE